MLNKFRIDDFEASNLKNSNSKIDTKIQFLTSLREIDKENAKKTFWTKIKNIFKG
jgi:hypothetical protein